MYACVARPYSRILRGLKMTDKSKPRAGKLTFIEDNLPDDNESIKVLVHAKYGGDGLPDWLTSAFFRETGLRIRDVIDMRRLRYDPVCLRLMREFAVEGVPVDPDRCRFKRPEGAYDDVWKAERIPIACREAFSITEYDGLESLQIDVGSLLLGILRGKNDDSSRDTLKTFKSIMDDCDRLDELTQANISAQAGESTHGQQ